jgi:hypothetical protein
MSRRERIEADINVIGRPSSDVAAKEWAAELQALWAIKAAARRHCMRPGCGATNHTMADALGAYEADNE